MIGNSSTGSGRSREEDAEEDEENNGDEAGGEAIDEDDGDREDDDLEKGRQELRMRQMRQKRERLSYAVERLTLQAGQKERQLRQSVARE